MKFRNNHLDLLVDAVVKAILERSAIYQHLLVDVDDLKDTIREALESV